MLVFMSFMGHNLLERFPGLNIGYLGAGVGWVPYWLDRVDEHWGGFFGVDAPSTQAPSLLFKSQGFAAADPWERTLPEVIEECGEKTILWGSQYPRPELAGLFPQRARHRGRRPAAHRHAEARRTLGQRGPPLQAGLTGVRALRESAIMLRAALAASWRLA